MHFTLVFFSVWTKFDLILLLLSGRCNNKFKIIANSEEEAQGAEIVCADVQQVARRPAMVPFLIRLFLLSFIEIGQLSVPKLI